VEPPSHGSFGSERSRVITAALSEAPPDFEAFRRSVRQRLVAEGVNPDQPHAQLDLQTLSAERRAWLQAGGSAFGGYHLGGLRSPAVVSTGVGAGMGLVMGTGSVLWSSERHPHAGRDVLMATGTGGAGGYLSGQIEFALNARWAPIQMTSANAAMGTAMRGMILPRVGSGTIAGGVTAPLMTWAVMGINQAFFGADLTGTDYAALGLRSATAGAVGGGVGAGAASLSIYLMGGAAAGSEVPILGNIIGAGVGLIAYFVVDKIWGDDVEQSVRSAMGEQGCKDRTVPE